MGKLVHFELIKAIKSKFFLIVFCLAVLASFMLQCGIREYQDYLQGIRYSGADVAVPVETFFEYAAGERKASRYQREENAALINDANGRFTVELVEQLNTTSDERLNAVLQSAEAFLEEAKADGNDFEVRRNEDILRLYSLPRERITAIVRYAGDALIETPSMLFVFLLILLTSAVSMAGERDRRTWLLLHTSKEGKGKTLLAKYLSGWLIGAVLTVVFQGVSITAVSFKGGMLGASQPVTVLDELALCPWPMLVWQYALLSLACQIFTAVILSTILTTVSAFSKNGLIAYVSGTLILGGGLLLLIFPPRTEWLAGPLALAEPWRYFNGYQVCSVFGVPVLWAALQAAMWAVAAAVLMLAANKVHCRNRRAI